jgi:hypothetical protein
MTAIAATTARTAIAIQAFRLTVIGFSFRSEGSLISTTSVVPSEIDSRGGLWRLAETAALDEKRLLRGENEVRTDPARTRPTRPD